MNQAVTKSMQLGFIGIGNMGSRIARRLIEHGYTLTVYDSNVERASELTRDGAVLASSVADLARKADVVLSCLTNDEAVRSVYFCP